MTRWRPSRCSRSRACRATTGRSRTPAAACAGCRPRCACGTTPSPRSARPPGRAPTAAPGGRCRSPPASAAPTGDCLLAAEEEDAAARVLLARVAAARRARGSSPGRCAASSSAASAPSAVEALTDWLLAARALLADPDQPGLRRAWPSGWRRSAPRAEDRAGAEVRDPRRDLARARRRGGARAPRAGRRGADLRARRRTCGRCCATCSAGTSSRRCAASPTSSWPSGPSPWTRCTRRPSGRGSSSANRCARTCTSPSTSCTSPSSSGTTTAGGSPIADRRYRTPASSRAASAASSCADSPTRRARSAPS